MLGADVLASQRLNVVKFDVGALAAPFHVLGHVSENEIPFRQSANPWYVNAWIAEDTVMCPRIDDPYSSEAPEYRISTRVHCRMIAGMVHVKYERAKQTLSISGKYCEVQHSASNMINAFIPLNCDTETVRKVHPDIYNKAMLMAGKLRGLGATSDEAADSEMQL